MRQNLQPLTQIDPYEKLEIAAQFLWWRSSLLPESTDTQEAKLARLQKENRDLQQKLQLAAEEKRLLETRIEVSKNNAKKLNEMLVEAQKGPTARRNKKLQDRVFELEELLRTQTVRQTTASTQPTDQKAWELMLDDIEAAVTAEDKALEPPRLAYKENDSDYSYSLFGEKRPEPIAPPLSGYTL